METNQYSNDCELVVALVAPIGVNMDDVQNRLESYIRQFNYETNFIHISKLIQSSIGGSPQEDSELERLENGMNHGNQLREKFSRGDYLALLVINAINKKRGNENDAPKPLGRKVHIIRSLKHPDEIETLRLVYGSGFFLLGVTASTEDRSEYLTGEKGIPEAKIERLVNRDDKEGSKYGQSTRDVFYLADAFIATNTGDLSDQISRIFDLLFGKPVVSPTNDEYAMFMAYSASLRSADLSRQVGAVILNSSGDLISTGANDVPKAGGGLYWPTEQDQRDFVRGVDSNEEQRNQIVVKVMKALSKDSSDSMTDEELLESGKLLLRDTGLLDITEYGRAVHAEMEAMLSAARNGIPVRDATLYTTTYPCHNCVKHLVAAGIRRVKYIEPYPKSYAKKLHDDSIEDGDRADADSRKVAFEPFIGIGPRKYIDLFSMSLGSGRRIKRKTDGKVTNWERATAELRVPMSPLSYIDSETNLLKELSDLEEEHADD